MSLEHLYEERLNSIITETPWPTSVYPDDLEQVGNKRAQNNSLGAAISHHIVEEGHELSSGLITKATRDLGKELTFRLRAASAIAPMTSAYTMPAKAILAAEAYISGDASSLTADLSLGGLISTSRSMGEFMQGLTSPHNRTELEAKVEDVNESGRANLAAGEPIASVLAERLTGGASFPELVDFYTDSQLQQFQVSERANSPEVQPVLSAFEKGRQRFHQLYDAVIQAEQKEQQGLQDFSANEAVDIVAQFLQQLSSQDVEKTGRIQEFHILMTEIGTLAERFIPYLENFDRPGPQEEEDEDDLGGPILEQDLFPVGITPEEFWNGESGIDYTDRITQIWKDQLDIRMDWALGDLAPNVRVTFLHNLDNKTDDPLVDAESIGRSGYGSRDHLGIDMHLDAKTAPQAERILRVRPPGWGAFHTYYYFDRFGKYIKTSWMLKEIQDDRTPLEDAIANEDDAALLGSLATKVLLSEMDDKDFQLVRQALTYMKQELVENLQRLESEKDKR